MLRATQRARARKIAAADGATEEAGKGERRNRGRSGGKRKGRNSGPRGRRKTEEGDGNVGRTTPLLPARSSPYPSSRPVHPKTAGPLLDFQPTFRAPFDRFCQTKRESTASSEGSITGANDFDNDPLSPPLSAPSSGAEELEEEEGTSTMSVLIRKAQRLSQAATEAMGLGSVLPSGQTRESQTGPPGAMSGKRERMEVSGDPGAEAEHT